MGAAVARRLMDEGRTLLVYNRTAGKAEALGKEGAQPAEEAGVAVAHSDVTVLTLTDKKAVDEIFDALGEMSLEGKTMIQMGTIAPAESRALNDYVTTRGGAYLECPVLGSRKEAAAGKLILMAAGREEVFEKYRDILACLGSDIYYLGEEIGKAAVLKLALNQLIAAHAAGFSLSLGMIQKNDIDIAVFARILKSSALYAPMFDKKLPNWLDDNYENPNFPTAHLLKDVDLIIREAKDIGQAAGVPAAVRALLQRAVEEGLGQKDYSSIYRVINNL